MADPDRTIWDGMFAHLRANRPSLCRHWFEQIEPLGLNAGVLHLRAHSSVHCEYLQRLCSEPFMDAAQAVSGRLMSVRFLGPEDDVRSPDTQDVVIEPKLAPLQHPPDHVRPDSLVIDPDYDFENFVVGPGNRLAHAAAQAVAAAPGQAYNPFFVHGDVGLGKTHLLQAICLRIRQENPQAAIYYTSCEGFMSQFMEAVQAGRMAQFRHNYRDVDVLVIDDIHFLAKRDRTQEEFFHTFNSLYQARKQIVLSSDAPPEEIPDLEQRLVSRFKWGLVTQIAAPCYETRVAILKQKARIRGLDLPDEVACHIAALIDTNIRELEGAITKLQIQAMVENRPIDMNLTKIAMGEAGPVTPAEITIQVIIDAVTEFYGVRLTDLQGKRRQRSIALPRQVCMYLARRHTRHSLEEIGGYFGGRDHTTVMHAVRSVEGKRGADTEFETVLGSLEDRVRTTDNN